MAMNKKEVEYVEELKTKLALRFTEKIEPDMERPDYGSNKIVNGWSFNSYSMSVNKSCSSCISHSLHGWDKTTSQNSIRQYSSRLLALKAMRNEVELKCAANIYKIDKMIESESAGR